MKIMVLGDLHAPYADRKALYWASLIRHQYQPDIIIQVGDIVDMKAWSRFPKSPEDENPALEWKKTAKEMKYIHQLFPEMKILLGNHSVRVARKALEAGIPKELIRSLEEVFDFEGWSWHLTDKPLIVDNIAFVHGDESPGNISVKTRQYGMSVVQGHSHKASLSYINLFDKQMFAAEVGWLGNDQELAFAYASKSPNRSWSGLMLITDGVPHLLPYGSSL